MINSLLVYYSALLKLVSVLFNLLQFLLLLKILVYLYFVNKYSPPLSYSTIVPYSRDHKGVRMTPTSPKIQPPDDDNGVVLVELSDQQQFAT